MSEASQLTRWLPTMLGGLLALGVVMAYELDLIEREPASSACPPAQSSEPETELGPREPLFTGARPHPSGQRDAAEAMAMEDRVALLEAQNQILAERAVTGEMGYYGLSQTELEAMARHCDVRTDYPTRLGEQDIEDLGLEAAEREAWQRALQAFAEQELESYRQILAEVAPETPALDELPLAQVRRELTRVVSRSRTDADEALRRHVAEERAGLREPPPDPAALSAWNRYNRLRFSAGDRFAELLADEVGEDRVHELRSAFEGWPGGRTRQWGCDRG